LRIEATNVIRRKFLLMDGVIGIDQLPNARTIFDGDDNDNVRSSMSCASTTTSLA
jgi:hypothetical protein